MRIDTELMCLHCDRETPHAMVYKGRYIQRIKCLECGTGIAIDSRRILASCGTAALERILTRSLAADFGINEKMRRELTALVASLPVRIITKPARVAKEFLDVFRQDK